MGRKRADVVLVERGLFDSRAKARAAIEAGGVAVDGRTLTKASELVDEAAAIEAVAAHPYVGRGALKLAHALGLWPVLVEGRTVLDVGASTGGFTEVSLERGAARVYAVDVGRGQLHPKLAGDPRVVGLEGVDARNLTAAMIPVAPDLIVTDVSFIGLAKVLPAALRLATFGADLVALVKPQFEVGRDGLGKNGIVESEELRRKALHDVMDCARREGLNVVATAPSPIEGTHGNAEWLLYARTAQA